MSINIITKNITLDRPLEVFVKEKIGALEKYLKGGQTIEARVEIGKPSKHHRSGAIFYAEANLNIGGILLRATSQQKDLRKAIVDVKNELQGQIKKFKEKHATSSRQKLSEI